MKILFSIFLFVFITGFSFSQTITFDKEFNFSISHVEQIADEDYIISGYDIEGLVVARLDESGFTKWIKVFEYVQEQVKTPSILLLNDGFFITTNILEINKINTDARLIKMDYEGNILYDKNYGTPFTDEFGYQVIEADAGTYFFITDTLLYKITQSGDVIWAKQAPYNLLFGNYLKNFMTKFSDNYYLILGFRSLISMDKNGDTLWVMQFSLPINQFPNIIKSSDGNILIFNRRSMMKLNKEGEVLQEVTLKPSGYTNYAIRKDDRIYLLYDLSTASGNSSIITLESDSIIVSEQELPIDAIQVVKTNDNGFLFNSTKYARYRLVKTDSTFYHKSVTLKNPKLSNYSDAYSQNENNQIYGLQHYTLTWEASDVENVNLDYSSDAGKSWINIVNNLSCDSSTYPPIGWYNLRYPRYEWLAPGIFSDEFLLRVIDSNDPSVFDKTDPFGSIFIYQDFDTIAANNITMWTNNSGAGSYDPRKYDSGFYWPNNIFPNISAIFKDGLVWGGKVNGEIRVNGNTYRDGLQPGRILEDGIADEPISVQSKIFKIRKDWQTLPEGVLKQRLEYDYNHWPVKAGAPWDDVNEDGVYTSGYDKPKYIGDETLFYVANDLDSTRSLFTYGSNPIGLEFQTTIFGFNREDLKDVVFKKYKVINKSNTDITDMYFTYWADVDMGDADDDLSAFDSTYNMAYVYNADNEDVGYGNSGYGTPPPAIAHMIVQGPIIPATNVDTARIDNGWRKGFKNIGMTSSGLIVKSSTIYPDDVPLGIYAGTLEFYNVMQGLKNNGSYVIDPTTNLPTIFPLTGDPVTNTGWYTISSGGFGQRYHVPTGPFNLAAGDTQEIAIAIIIAKGTDNINSITKLRELAANVQDFYDNEFVEILNTKQTIAPTGYTLYQNYPNPFNPKTTIEYEVPEKSFVTIKIYDILGREVQTLVNNEEKVRWRYKVVFNASSFASGIYFYRIQAGSFTETKKMILLK